MVSRYRPCVIRTRCCTPPCSPATPAFEYRFRIPADEPPGLYWYHPHIHGFSSRQVLGGASGAMIIEGIEQRHP